jgi:hypothetical protein
MFTSSCNNYAINTSGDNNVLNELSVATLKNVVVARGIDRVIVVGTSEHFANASQVNNLSNANVTSLKNDGVDIKLATTNGQAIKTTQSSLNLLSNFNLNFLTNSEFSSLTAETTIVSGNKLSTANSSTEFSAFNPNSTNIAGAYTTALNQSTEKPGFGSQQELQAISGSFTGLNDLNGSITLNISATDFVSVLGGTISSTNVSNKENLNVGPVSASPLITPNHGDIYHRWTGVIPEFTGTNRIGNLSTASQGGYIWQNLDNSLTLNSKQVLALPLEGLHNKKFRGADSKEVILQDSLQNVSTLISQLSDAQLQSFNQIKLTDGSSSDLNLTAKSFARLNKSVSKFNRKNNITGIESIVDQNGNSVAINITGTADEVKSAFIKGATSTDLIPQLKNVGIYLNNTTDFTGIPALIKDNTTSSRTSNTKFS